MLIAKKFAFAGNHLAYSRCHRAGVHALVADDLVARGEIVTAFGDIRANATLAGGKNAPGGVHRNNCPGRIEHTDLSRERIESGAGEAIRFRRRGFRLPARGNIPRDSTIALELALPVIDRLPLP